MIDILIYVGLRFLQGNVGLLSNIQTYLWIDIAQFTTRKVSVDMFDHLLELSLRFHINRKTGEILRAQKRGVMSIVAILSSVLFQVVPTLVDIGIAVAYFTVAFDKLFGIIVFVTMSLYIAATIILTDWRTGYRRKANVLENLMEAKAVDTLLNYETVKYYAAEDFESKEYQKAVDDYQDADKISNATIYILTLVQNVIIQAGLLVGGLLCAYQVTQGQKTVGDFVLYLAYILQLYQPLNDFGSYYKSIQKNLVDMEKMLDLMHEPVEVKDPIKPTPLNVEKGEIEFRNVTFAYDERNPILKNVSFRVPSGQTVAIVGPSGGGKSTLLRLLLRFYDIQEGCILIDGIDVKEVKQQELRGQIGVVPQDTVLFNNTIKYNIRYSRIDGTDEEVAAAAVAAKIHEKILGFPDGYDTKVGERGLRLSGGEKQRVAIARTVLKNPQIVLLDEATSALDTSTERHIQKSLQQMTVNRTTLIIAHRLSTIVHADQILVVKAGEIVERGSHDELMQRENGVYFKLWNKQLKERLKVKSKIKRLGRATSVRSRKNSRRYKAPAPETIAIRVEEDVTPQPMPPLPVSGPVNESIVARYRTPRTMTPMAMPTSSSVVREPTPQTVPSIHGDAVNESADSQEMIYIHRSVGWEDMRPQTMTSGDEVNRSVSGRNMRPHSMAYNIHNNEANESVVRGNVRPYTMTYIHDDEANESVVRGNVRPYTMTYIHDDEANESVVRGNVRPQRATSGDGVNESVVRGNVRPQRTTSGDGVNESNLDEEAPSRNSRRYNPLDFLR
ncbi:10983_t:CDS:10 [Paraglomus brasilianum]|uniref:10983_t:CDS:1 n=1 Tax=Paraglomus brasilianum TaxID=144538 RepID=A0A9N8ZZ15_9GLOM|nr:10983_t:CDS:10 [Paraglomus brasilianum]